MPSALLYDADCGFCRVCVAVLLAWDRRSRLQPIAIQDATGALLLADLTPQQRLDSWHLVRDRSSAPGDAPPDAGATGGAPTPLRSAGAAFPVLLALLPGGRPPAALARRFPGATERGYRWVARHRSPLGRLLPGRVRRWADRTISRRGQALYGHSRSSTGWTG